MWTMKPQHIKYVVGWLGMWAIQITLYVFLQQRFGDWGVLFWWPVMIPSVLLWARFIGWWTKENDKT